MSHYKKALFIILNLLLLSVLLYSNNYSNIIFYIVAHQDDWQLFVGDLAYEDIMSDSSKVVFIYTTAGESNLGESYWRDREKGCIESIRFIKGMYSFSGSDVEYYGQDTIKNHIISYYKYANTSSYFLRIPNNRLSDIENGISHYTVDNTSIFQNWDDLYSTIYDLINTETSQINDIQIFSHEPDPELNPSSHIDHRVTGRLTLQIKDSINCNVLLFKDYTTYSSYNSNLPVNLDMFSIMNKAGLFLSYDKKVYDECQHCTTCEPLGYHYTQWLFRTYISRELFSDSSEVIQNNKLNIVPNQYILYQNYPNPFNQKTVLSFDLNNESKVLLTIYAPNGKLIETIENRILPKGHYNYSWYPNDISSGIYFYKLRVNNSYTVKKCILLK